MKPSDGFEPVARGARRRLALAIALVAAVALGAGLLPAVWVVKSKACPASRLLLLMNYAVHSVVGGPANSLVTGDLAGMAERFVERQYQDKVVALWTMGPAGDQDPKFTRSLMAVE